MSEAKERPIDRLLGAGQTKAALAYLRASGAESLDAPTFLSLVAACARTKDAESMEAAGELLSRVSLPPEDLPRLATAMAEAGAHAQALRCIEMMDADRDRFGVLELKARVLRGLGRGAEAEAVFERMQELYPYALKSWTGPAAYYKGAHNRDMEIECLQQALKLKLKDVPMLKRLAVLKAASGDRRGSLAIWQQLTRIAPADGEAALEVLDKFVKLKNFGNASAWLAAKAHVLPAGEPLQRLQALIAQNAADAAQAQAPVPEDAGPASVYPDDAEATASVEPAEQDTPDSGAPAAAGDD